MCSPDLKVFRRPASGKELDRRIAKLFTLSRRAENSSPNLLQLVARVRRNKLASHSFRGEQIFAALGRLISANKSALRPPVRVPSRRRDQLVGRIWFPHRPARPLINGPEPSESDLWIISVDHLCGGKSNSFG